MGAALLQTLLRVAEAWVPVLEGSWLVSKVQFLVECRKVLEGETELKDQSGLWHLRSSWDYLILWEIIQ